MEGDPDPALELIEKGIRDAERQIAEAMKKRDALIEAARALRSARLSLEGGVATGGRDIDRSNPTSILSPRPTTREVVAAILRQYPGQSLTTRRLTSIAQSHQLLNSRIKYPQNTMLEAAKRLVQQDHRFRRITDEDGQTTWVYVGEEAMLLPASGPGYSGVGVDRPN